MSKLVIIDPGHGGTDPGAVNSNGLKESDLVLGISNDLCKMLDEQGIRNIATRRYRETYVKLSKRVQISNNEDADLFVSIHINSVEDNPATEKNEFEECTGSEVCHFGPNTKILAASFSKAISSSLSIADRGPKERPDLHVLRNTKCPALLLEICFIQKDITKLFSFANRLALIEAITKQIRKALNEV